MRVFSVYGILKALATNIGLDAKVEVSRKEINVTRRVLVGAIERGDPITGFKVVEDDGRAQIKKLPDVTEEETHEDERLQNGATR